MVKSNVVYCKFDKAQRELRESVDAIAAELETQPPLVSEGFYRVVEKNFLEDTSRRLALMYLAQPWADTSEGIKQDRQAAIGFAKVAECLDESIAFCKSLESILTTAQNRIRAAVSQRDDARAIVAEVRQALAAESALMRATAEAEEVSAFLEVERQMQELVTQGKAWPMPKWPQSPTAMM